MVIVEVRRNGDDLAAPMSQMRTWLDDQRIQPSVFLLSVIPGGMMFLLEFKAVSEAEAFAQAFGGQVIGDEHAGTLSARTGRSSSRTSAFATNLPTSGSWRASHRSGGYPSRRVRSP
jgi:hypothetical protein